MCWDRHTIRFSLAALNNWKNNSARFRFGPGHPLTARHLLHACTRASTHALAPTAPLVRRRRKDSLWTSTYHALIITTYGLGKVGDRNY